MQPESKGKEIITQDKDKNQTRTSIFYKPKKVTEREKTKNKLQKYYLRYVKGKVCLQHSYISVS